MKLREALVVMTFSIIVIALVITVGDLYSNNSIQFLGVEKIYGGYKYAAIIRVDDFIVDKNFSKFIPDSVAVPKEYFFNYENNLIHWVNKNSFNVSFTVGVITGCKTGNCTYYWFIYNDLVRRGWEIASHTRWHVRPPRNESDFLGAIHDIESNISSYRVLTYIPPFGKTSEQELKLLSENTCVKIIMTTWPFQYRIPLFDNEITKMGFTVKLSDKFPWKTPLRLFIYFEEKIHGLLIIYTHATSFDWKKPFHLINAMTYAFTSLGKTDAWITTPRILWLYENEVHNTRVVSINKMFYKVLYSTNGGLCGLKPIPITLVFKLKPSLKIEEILLNNHSLRFLKKIPYNPIVGYTIHGNNIYINIIPVNNETIKLIYREAGK